MNRVQHAHTQALTVVDGDDTKSVNKIGHENVLCERNVSSESLVCFRRMCFVFQYQTLFNIQSERILVKWHDEFFTAMTM